MRILVESLKRLYESDRVTKEELLDRVASGKITQEEYDEWRYNYPMSAARENHKKLMELWDKKKNGE